MDLAAGIQVAQLALKHRQNKKQQQRIIVFAGRCLQLCLIVSFHFIFPVLTFSSYHIMWFQSYQTREKDIGVYWKKVKKEQCST